MVLLQLKHMKVIKFFCLIGLLAVIASAVAENTIVSSSFFKQYLDRSIASTHQAISLSDIPTEVIESFMQSPYKDLHIHEVQKIEDHASFSFAWATYLMPAKAFAPEVQYVLSLGDDVSQQVVAIVSFDYKGKLLTIRNI